MFGQVKVSLLYLVKHDLSLEQRSKLIYDQINIRPNFPTYVNLQNSDLVE